MKNFVCLIIILCFFKESIQSQQLHFIRGIIDQYVHFNQPPITQLLQYTPERDSVLTVRNDYTSLLYQDYGQLQSIVQYDNNRIIIFSAAFNNSFFYLDMDVPDSLIRLHLKCPKNYELPLNINIINKSVVYRCFCDECSMDTYSLYRKLEKNMSDFSDITPEVYKDLYLTGTYFYGYADSQRGIIKPNDGRIYLPVVADTVKRPPMDTELPSQYWVQKKTYINININNIDHTVLFRDSHPPVGTDSVGRSMLLIWNKSKDHWFEYTLKGNSTTVRSNGHWLFGTVKDGRDRRTKYFPQKESPGRAVRDSAHLSFSFDDRVFGRGGNLYSPGILYLFNVDTKKYIEWHTNQGDSEILLVQEKTVYYRIFDAIYKALIINGERLEEPELLVKDNQLVPFIHWAFLGK
ncbi:MAG: hypothetical protein LBL58_18500 [Tannerellaceae bacterium]|nr:hypothetical protein [Tannerellaceae bacterium]